MIQYLIFIVVTLFNVFVNLWKYTWALFISAFKNIV